MTSIIPQKQCTKCKQIKPLIEFRKNIQSTDGRSYRCRICCSEIERQRHRKNPDKRNNYAKSLKRERKSKGLCTHCGHKNDTPNFSYCKKCRDYQSSKKDGFYSQHRTSCVICDFEYSDVHHIDGNHSNDEPSNLISLCPNHHRMVHWGLLSIIRRDK